MSITLGGNINLGRGKQMIYKEINFKMAPLLYNLEFEDSITLVGGDSGTGKTFLYSMLEDLRLTEEFSAIHLYNYKTADRIKEIFELRNCFIVIDNAAIILNNELKRFINFEPSNQYMLFGRNCTGLNVSKKSFKYLTRKGNKITLEDGLCVKLPVDFTDRMKINWL